MYFNQAIEKLGNDPFGMMGGIDTTNLTFPTAEAKIFTPNIPRGECPTCGKPYEDQEFGCPVCSPCDPNVDYPKVEQKRLRVVGNKAPVYQADFDRIRPVENRKKNIYLELSRYNRDFQNMGGNAFPDNVLKTVADTYCIVQNVGIKRNKAKKSILAALIFNVCIHYGFTRSYEDISELLKAEDCRFSLGVNYLRSVDEDVGLDININCDRLIPHIASTFAYLEIENDPRILSAVEDIIKTAEENYIGIKSTMRSKVIASTFEVLKRSGRGMSLSSVSKKCKIRSATLNGFLEKLFAYHSHFKPIYEKYGMETTNL